MTADTAPDGTGMLRDMAADIEAGHAPLRSDADRLRRVADEFDQLRARLAGAEAEAKVYRELYEAANRDAAAAHRLIGELSGKLEDARRG